MHTPSQLAAARTALCAASYTASHTAALTACVVVTWLEPPQAGEVADL